MAYNDCQIRRSRLGNDGDSVYYIHSLMCGFHDDIQSSHDWIEHWTRKPLSLAPYRRVNFVWMKAPRVEAFDGGGIVYHSMCAGTSH